ncbi:modified peptide precursor CbpA [Propionivibrio soli]|uniref:modified peptide precursor CbpA n=1 Tax=Propionivibrio soli TaxID=2976531 RepID=UPI0021E88ABC
MHFAGALFVFVDLIEEQIMSNAIQTPANAQPAKKESSPIIAVRKSCNPDGIGLSHYVLMDRKAAK